MVCKAVSCCIINIGSILEVGRTELALYSLNAHAVIVADEIAQELAWYRKPRKTARSKIKDDINARKGKH